jgi:hypothetical protein
VLEAFQGRNALDLTPLVDWTVGLVARQGGCSCEAAFAPGMLLSFSNLMSLLSLAVAAWYSSVLFVVCLAACPSLFLVCRSHER